MMPSGTRLGLTIGIAGTVFAWSRGKECVTRAWLMYAVQRCFQLGKVPASPLVCFPAVHFFILRPSTSGVPLDVWRALGPSQMVHFVLAHSPNKSCLRHPLIFSARWVGVRVLRSSDR